MIDAASDTLPDGLPDEADVLRAADAWHVDGFSVWDAVSAQIAAEIEEPVPVRADVLRRALYETEIKDAPEAGDGNAAALFALVRDLQNEVSLLRREVEALRQQAVPKPIPPRPIMPLAPSLFPLGTPVD